MNTFRTTATAAVLLAALVIPTAAMACEVSEPEPTATVQPEPEPTDEPTETPTVEPTDEPEAVEVLDAVTVAAPAASPVVLAPAFTG